MKDENLKIAIVPGSFDPITYGHLDLVQQAAKQYDKVYLAVMINREKNYMFTLAQREKLAQIAVADMSNVQVVSSEGMLWKLAYDLKAIAIVKGYRNEVDLAYEQKMAEFNRAHNPQAETILLKAKDSLRLVSSTLVRENIKSGKDLEALMPQAVAQEAYHYLSQK